MPTGKRAKLEDFATGWLQYNGNVTGRPVDVIVGTDGALLVTDDTKADLPYRLHRSVTADHGTEIGETKGRG